MKKLLQTIFLFLFFLTFLASQSGLAAAQVTNLVAGKPYNSSPAANAPYDDPGTKLTDEYIAQLTPTDQGWVGYGFDEPVISFTLGSPAELTQVRAHFLEQTGWGIHYPQAVEVQTSLDNEAWVSQGNLQQQGEYFELNLANVEASHVRLLINRLYWTFISEIEIYGQPPVVPPTAPEPIKPVLFLTSTKDQNNESYNRMINTLDGIGLTYDVIEDNQILTTDLSAYQLVIVDGTSFELLDIDLAAEQHIVASIEQGVNYLWIGAGIWGSFQTTNLPDAFGLQYVQEGTSLQFGVTQGEFIDLTGNLTKFPIYNEYVRQVQPTQATVEGWYYAGATKQPYPLVTKYQTPNGAHTVYISLPMLDFWKSTEAEYTYARTEMLTKYIRQLTTQGYVGVHPVKNGKEATFLLRLEDYTPGGTYIDHSTPGWLGRMERFLEFTVLNQIPLNIALIPLYSHPFLSEEFSWTDTVQQIPLLKQYALEAVAGGGSLIVHGYKHQNGSAEDDYSGDDWEMWNEDTQQFLSFAQQQEITDNAIAEAGIQFGYTPTIWETPHYISNENTYLAAKSSGFTFFTESDTKLFPNQRGYLNKSNGNLWNIPETAFDFPEDNASIAAIEPIKKDYILPRLVRLNAPYYLFYHNNLNAQLSSLSNITAHANVYNMWYPSLEEFGNFWLQKEQAGVTAVHDTQNQKITATVSNSFEGLTLAVRLPNGTQPEQVLVNGVVVQTAQKLVDGIWFAYPVMPVGNSATVEVSYSAAEHQSLVGHWQLDENQGIRVFDSTEYTNRGTLVGDPSWTPGKLGSALRFDGINDNVVFGSNTNLLRNVQQASVSLWLKKPVMGDDEIALDVTTGPNTVSRLEVQITSSGNVLIGGRAGDTERFQTKTTTTSPITLNEWHHVVGIVDYANDTIAIYVNGVEQATTGTVRFTATATSNTSPREIRFGANGGGIASFFTGLLDDIRLYDHALTPQEIADLL